MNHAIVEKYARLIVKAGVNIQKGQVLVINSPIECAGFAREVARNAYIEGAGEVEINWSDELFTKIRYEYAPEDVFDKFPQWRRDLYISNAKEGAAFLNIYAEDPELLRDIDHEKIARNQKSRMAALKEYYDRTMSNRNVWCVASVPTTAWAKKVFPDLQADMAMERLWEEIIKTVKIDKPDPVAAWETHKSNLKKSLDFLNNNNFKYLRYRNSIGTDLTIKLPDGHRWLGGSDFTPEGREFLANMPTEEVFTLPEKTGVNGTVVSTMPLSYNGKLIEDFAITLKDGKITDYTAKNGSELLKSMIDTDEGSHYLGEVALVPYDSPISQSKILFYNTLFDENASCHLAIGGAYPVCLKNGEDMSEAELAERGANYSLVHEDFMIGTADLDITGVTDDDREIKVFEKGRFAY